LLLAKQPFAAERGHEKDNGHQVTPPPVREVTKPGYLAIIPK
jgi:hypothetical protein